MTHENTRVLEYFDVMSPVTQPRARAVDRNTARKATRIAAEV